MISSKRTVELLYRVNSRVTTRQPKSTGTNRRIKENLTNSTMENPDGMLFVFLGSLSLLKKSRNDFYADCNFTVQRRPYWWGGVVNLFGHVTAFSQSDYIIDQSN